MRISNNNIINNLWVRRVCIIFIFVLFYFNYIFFNGSNLLEASIKTIGLLSISLIIIFFSFKSKRYKIRITFITLMIISFIFFVSLVPSRSDEVIGFYLGYAPIILFVSFVLPLTLMAYLLKRYGLK